MKLARLHQRVGPKKTALFLVTLGILLLLIGLYSANRANLVAFRLYSTLRSWIEHPADADSPGLSARVEGNVVIQNVEYPLSGTLHFKAPNQISLTVLVQGNGEYRIVNGDRLWIIAEQARAVVVGTSLPQLSSDTTQGKKEPRIMKAGFGDFRPFLARWFPPLARYKLAMAKPSDRDIDGAVFLDIRSSDGNRLFGVCDFVVVGILPGRWIPCGLRTQGRYGNVPFAARIDLRDMAFDVPIDSAKFVYTPDPSEMTVIEMPRAEILKYLTRFFRN